jgi:uncharacterized protein
MKIFLKRFVGVALFSLVIISILQAQELRRRGFTGLQVADLSADNRAKLTGTKGGAQVQKVFEKGSGQDAGLQANDIIVRLNDFEIESAGNYVAAVGKFFAGDEITIHFVRDGKPNSKTIKLKPRPLEKDAEVDTFYESVTVDNSLRRTIITAPKTSGKHPALLYITGVGCFSQESANFETSDAKLLYGLTKAGFVTMRVEKSGMGDSEGKSCNDPAVDMQAEIRGYLEGLKALKKSPLVDAEKVFIVGLSIGGIEAPQIAAQIPVKGIVVVNTAAKPFMEYLLETRRRQMSLRNTPPDEIDRRALLSEVCNHRLLIEKQTPEQLLRDLPSCRESIEYPAPYTFIQQWAALNFGEMWKRAAAQTLVVSGKSDFVATIGDAPLLVNIINSFRQGTATLAEIEGMDHYMTKAATMEASMKQDATGEFEPQVIEVIKKWMRERI